MREPPTNRSGVTIPHSGDRRRKVAANPSDAFGRSGVHGNRRPPVRWEVTAAPDLAADFPDFTRYYPFGLDAFQLEACEALDAGEGVLVARRPAPARPWSASSPSTWRCGPAASASTPRRSRRCRTRSTTTWSRATAPDQVGLLTGDNAINGDAPVVVMTTEVLRNMLYAGSPTLPGLGYVVMDEVHYLADRFRGAVWEEVIIHLPESVRWCRCRRPSPTPRSSPTGW